MNNLFNLSEEEKNRIRGLHITESKDKSFLAAITSLVLIVVLKVVPPLVRLSSTLPFVPRYTLIRYLKSLVSHKQ